MAEPLDIAERVDRQRLLKIVKYALRDENLNFRKNACDGLLFESVYRDEQADHPNDLPLLTEAEMAMCVGWAASAAREYGDPYTDGDLVTALRATRDGITTQSG